HRRMLEKIVRGHVRHYGRPVFLAKRPDMVMRIRWIAAGLPNARFIHVLRDGRAVANSILVQCRRRGVPRWSYIGKGMWPELAEMESVAYSGAIWARSAMLADRSLSTLDGDRVLTVRYEEFVREPLRILEETAAFCGVSWREEHREIVPHLEDRNYKWKEQMSPEEQERMLEQARPGLDHFGYGDTES
ncbi:MAG: sulfotransferase family protein, partial [Planctomycetota bacterium]